MNPAERPAAAAAPSTRLPALYPRPGRRLHRRLRARRIHLRAEALPAGLADPGLLELLTEIDGSPPWEGNRSRPYFVGVEAFDAMRRAVREARHEVLLESYIFKHDDTGRSFRRELAAAAGRGVPVRVLVDALGSVEAPESFWREMREAGIDVRHFHPLLSRLSNQPFRDHRKILVVDRRLAFTGGLNIADEYGASMPSKGAGWRDSHIEVEGPVARELAAVFAEGWQRAGGSPLPAQLPGGGAEEAGEARMLVLESRPRRGHRETAAVMAAVVAAARRSVWITNAYFAPRRVAVETLGRAAARGVDVRLLLPGETDVPLVRHAGHGSYSALLRRGVRLFEYTGSVLHAKSLVADGLVSVMGSSNLDFRSFRFNAECNLVVFDTGTAERIAAAFERDLECAEEIDLAAWRRRPFYHRLGDRLARTLSPLL